jgi:SNF2 family DNA or RNA helicase
MVELLPFQAKILENTENRNKVAYFLDMGLGKTFLGAEKLLRLKAPKGLIICQKSKICDWIEHFQKYYGISPISLRKKSELARFLNGDDSIGIINYESAIKRPELLKLKNFTLLLDETSMIKNERSKRGRFCLKLKPGGIILLSGTPISGKYEEIFSQAKLLGWEITKKQFLNHFCILEKSDFGGFWSYSITGYKNIDRLKQKLKENGAIFLKTEEVGYQLPNQTFQKIYVDRSSEYKKFMRDCFVTIGDKELVGDTPLTRLLYARLLCGEYSSEKNEAFLDILRSTSDRLVIFYNFTGEFLKLKEVAEKEKRPVSVICGAEKTLKNFEERDNGIIFVQYQAGAMGLNLQKANKLIYFSLPLSCELFMQSKKRIHRIGQNKPCFYYFLMCRGSVEEKILSNLERGVDYTDKLFSKDFGELKKEKALQK